MTTRPKVVDVSEAAVEARLPEVVALNRLCESLAEAGRAAGLTPPRRPPSRSR